MTDEEAEALKAKVERLEREADALRSVLRRSLALMVVASGALQATMIAVESVQTEKVAKQLAEKSEMITEQVGLLLASVEEAANAG